MAERLPHEKFQKLRKIVDTMHERSVHIYNEKRAAIERGDEGLKQQLGEGKDIMSILREHFIVHGRPRLCSLEVRQSEQTCLPRLKTDYPRVS